MNYEARDKLKKFIATYGAAVCNTPRSCEMFLLTQLADYPDERKVLIEALRQGAVAKLIAKEGGRSWDSLSGELVEQLRSAGGLSDDEASFAINSWGMALGKHPDSVSIRNEPAPPPPPDLDPTMQADARTKLTAFLPIVAGGGALGSAIGAGAIGLVLLLFVSVFSDMEAKLAKSKTKSGSVQSAELGAVAYILVSTAICFAGGGVGSALGWVIGKGTTNPWGGAKACFWSGLIASAIAARVCFLVPATAAIPAALATFGAALSSAHGLGRR